jgi:hypothetical protein
MEYTVSTSVSDTNTTTRFWRKKIQKPPHPPGSPPRRSRPLARKLELQPPGAPAQHSSAGPPPLDVNAVSQRRLTPCRVAAARPPSGYRRRRPPWNRRRRRCLSRPLPVASLRLIRLDGRTALLVRYPRGLLSARRRSGASRTRLLRLLCSPIRSSR